MFRIRKLQMEVLAAASLVDFVDEAVALVASLELSAPPSAPSPAGEPLRAWVERRIARGLELGLVEEGSVLRHVEVAARFGEAFADELDVLGALDDPELCEDWSSMLAIFTAQAKGPGEDTEGDPSWQP